MLKTLFLPILLFFILSAKAQKPDTTIYKGCKAANDTTQTIGEASILDSCPQFINGFDNLYKFIAAHKHYPINAKKNHIEGRVIISIIIEKDGSISHVTMARGISKDLDKEAARIMWLLPKWEPGILHKKPVRVRYFIPVKFKLPSKKA